jgi:hypothetical protein
MLSPNTGHWEVSGVTGKASLKGEPSGSERVKRVACLFPLPCVDWTGQARSGIAAALTPWPIEKSQATRHLLIFRQALILK